MNKKTAKIIFWISTALLSLMILAGAGMYVFTHDVAVANFNKLGFPLFLIYPMAAAKVLGIVAILTRKSPVLKEWAYAGLFINLSLAVMAHVNIGDGEAGGAAVALVLMLVSRLTESTAFAKSED